MTSLLVPTHCLCNMQISLSYSEDEIVYQREMRYIKTGAAPTKLSCVDLKQ